MYGPGTKTGLAGSETGSAGSLVVGDVVGSGGEAIGSGLVLSVNFSELVAGFRDGLCV